MLLRKSSTIRSTDSSFAIAARDELWIDGRLAERRLSCGSAIDHGPRIVAVHSLDEELIRTCDAAIDEMRVEMRLGIDRDARVRPVATPRRGRGCRAGERANART